MEARAIILGAGAAGLFCAGGIGAGAVVIDHADAPGEKIRISGGGRCNFTNLRTGPENFLSENRHFHKSALAGFTPHDFLALVEGAGIAWHEKAAGQLFCDGRAGQIVTMLVERARRAGAELRLGTRITGCRHDGTAFAVATEGGVIRAPVLVVATGGRSIPRMGATGLGHDLARQFGLRVTALRPALVPFTFSDNPFAALAGVSLPVRVRVRGGRAQFDEAMLFTHRGLSGPAMLQISSYWREGEEIAVDLAPGRDLRAHLRDARALAPRRSAATLLADILPQRLVQHLARHLARHLAPDPDLDLGDALGTIPDRRFEDIARALHDFRLRPTGTEGYRTAEVTLGGVDTRDLSSRSMAAQGVPGLYFIGECVDVTGWLGGYNFQWAWASAHAAARAIAGR
ncbi:MAG: NAD(P)/FAD-dependent oxidoreductase [Rubellimicrobium sp.]|nr:NAD(P)/FAD-dependent oxidoreductase [Rubellimicrobium sp.]